MDAKLFKVHYGCIFYKFLNPSMNHFGFQYHEGLNVDIHELSFSVQHKGGLCFTNKQNLYNYTQFGNTIYRILIPDDAIVVIGYRCFKADKIILNEVVSLSDIFTDKEIEKYPELKKLCN